MTNTERKIVDHMLAPYDRTCDALNAIAAHLRKVGE